MEIVDYEEKYANEISNIAIRNLKEVNSKDYGNDHIEHGVDVYQVNNVKEDLKNRDKVLVALENGKVVGTASLAKSPKDGDGVYRLLTVYVMPENHSGGIGKALVLKLEDYAKKINVKKILVPASITAHKFYHKLGYEYVNGKIELNEENTYMMEKIFI